MPYLHADLGEHPGHNHSRRVGYVNLSDHGSCRRIESSGESRDLSGKAPPERFDPYFNGLAETDERGDIRGSLLPFDAVQSEPGLWILLKEYNKYLLRRAASLLGI